MRVGKPIRNIRIVKGKDGRDRLVEIHKFRSVSDKIRKGKSKRSRAVSRSAASQLDLMLRRK